MSNVDPSIMAGCIAAAGAVYAKEDCTPSPLSVITYARKLYAVYMGMVEP